MKKMVRYGVQHNARRLRPGAIIEEDETVVQSRELRPNLLNGEISHSFR
jgi:hypothetical protein